MLAGKFANTFDVRAASMPAPVSSSSPFADKEGPLVINFLMLVTITYNASHGPNIS